FDAFSRTYPHYDPDPLGHFASRAYDLLPQPFEWVPIPAGKVTIGYGDWENGQYVVKRTQDFHIESYAIAKYPVTNAQYEVFVKHPDGYKNPKWWDYSDKAKQWRAGRPEINPSEFYGSDCPRETISWYDSVAFCLWLSAMTGDNISLPTEQQWQRAAIGDTQNVYPWGDEIDVTYANYGHNVGRTTPVTQYPKGASPYGVMDMSGNVLEWCLTEYESGDIKLTGNSARVLRGGSWNSFLTYVRSVDRVRYFPTDRFSNVGLRCVRSHLLF
ncbi:MAG: SUMF1/EgtB/PvdO family nonheme iron enzyme, partial [Phototrophicales bacterium]|nr:SUMF1/EgtB/PvdO family nonheme iron enzyme [Phototrophicales bacterium]